MQTVHPSSSIKVRRAARGDAPALLRLIVALAEFEKLTPPDEAAQQRLLEHGFGPHPRFEAWLGFIDDVPEPIGYALLFETYSSFDARPTLHLEDIFVRPEFRGRGVGTMLIRNGIHLAHSRGCARMEWTCLDWNTRAQAGYERIGAQRLSHWILYRLERDKMAELIGKPEKES